MSATHLSRTDTESHRHRPWGRVVAALLSLMPMYGAVGEGRDASRALQYRIQGYVVEGAPGVNGAEMTTRMSQATGERVSLAGVRAAMVELRQYLKEQGYPQASVALPRQPLTNGVVTLQVNLGTRAVAEGGQPESESGLPGIAAWRPSGFDIRHFVVRGNSVLSAEELDRPATRPKTIRIKRPDGTSGRKPLTISRPEEAETSSVMQPAGTTEDLDSEEQPGVFVGIMAIAALLVSCVLLYCLLAQTLAPTLPFPGRIL